MVLILDTTVLINFIDHCLLPDIMDLMHSYPFEIHIVKTVQEEYEKGLKSRPGSVDSKRYYHHLHRSITVVDDSVFIPVIPNEFLGLHAGELMSAIYKQQTDAPMILCTDDNATHRALLAHNGKKCLWSTDILVLLHQRHPSLIRQRDAKQVYQQIINNGFIGIPPQKIDFNQKYDFCEYY